jgi:hypothetical protein
MRVSISSWHHAYVDVEALGKVMVGLETVACDTSDLLRLQQKQGHGRQAKALIDAASFIQAAMDSVRGAATDA